MATESAHPITDDAPPEHYAFPSEVLQQMKEMEALLEGPQSAGAHVALAQLLVSNTLKIIAAHERHERSFTLARFIKTNLFLACTRYQSANEIEPKNYRVLLEWADTLLLITINFDLPLFELALDNLHKAMALEASNDAAKPKILRRHGTALSIKADYGERQGIDSDVSVVDLDNLADEKFGQALALKPDSAATLIRWADALSNRLRNRSHSPSDAIELLAEVAAKFHQALTLKPKNHPSCLSNWGKCIDYAVRTLLQKGVVTFERIQPYLEAYFDLYRHLASKGSVPLKPLMTVAEMESTPVQALAVGFLVELASTAADPAIKEEAAKSATSLKALIAARKEQYETNMKQTLATIEALPKVAQKELTRSKLTPQDIAPYYDVFMNCLYFLVDKETAKDPVFDYSQKKKKKGPTNKSSKAKYSAVDFDKMVKKEDPGKTYRHQTYIGRGGFGEVFIGEVGRSKVALKVLEGQPDSDQILRSLAEVDAMKRCKHKNIVKFIDCYYYNGALTIAMEYCDGGTLHDLYHEVYLSEGEISYFLRQICEGLCYFHGEGLAHLDIKSENILLNLDCQVRIADFGLVREANGTDPILSGLAGTCYFMAPEIILRNGYNNKADIWALGCVALELAQGEPPNHELGPLRAMFHTATVGAAEMYPRKDSATPKWSREFLDFLKVTLHSDPNQRPSAAQLLAHPLLQNTSPSLRDLRKKLELVFIGASLRMNGLL